MAGYEIAKHSSIKWEALDPNQYTLTLMKEAYRTGLIDKQAIYGIQEQVMLVLRELILRYTKGESASVKTETAEGLLHSIYYCMDAYLKSFDTPEAGIELLKPSSIREVYGKGVEAVTAVFVEAEEFCRGLVKNRLEVPLEVYKTSVTEALPEFFRSYSVVLGAHDTTCSLDYPLIFDDMNVKGVFYIRNYLETLNTETEFCKLFSKADTDKLLAVYGRTCRVDYREAPVNLFEILLNNSIFSAMSGSSAANLKITRSQFEVIRERITGLDYEQTSGIVHAAAHKLIFDLNICRAELIKYIYRYSRDFVLRVLNAAGNDNLSNIIMITAEEKVSNKGKAFIETERLPDAGFRHLIRRIKDCSTAEDKVRVIMSEVHSLEDYLDILNADCLFGDEYGVLFAALGDMELAVLAKALPGDELESNKLNLLTAGLADEGMAAEWQPEYLRFVRGLEENRRKRIEELSDVLVRW